MSKVVIIMLSFSLFLSCTSIRKESDTLDCGKTINELITKDGIITFYDSLKDGIGPRNSNIILVFRPEGKVSLYSYAYNIHDYDGYFKVIDNQILIYPQSIHFYGSKDKYSFPLLILEKAQNGLKLIRVDSRKDLKEHWNVYEFNKEIFPLSTNKEKRRVDQEIELDDL